MRNHNYIIKNCEYTKIAIVYLALYDRLYLIFVFVMRRESGVASVAAGAHRLQVHAVLRASVRRVAGAAGVGGDGRSLHQGHQPVSFGVIIIN